MIDFERLNKIKALVELVLGYDTEKLRNENDVRRIQLWNEIKNNESIFEQEFIRDLPTDLREEIASQFSFAELRLASVEQVGDESPGISSSFNKAELAIAPIYDRYSVLDVSSA